MSRRPEHLHTLALMNELDQAQHSDIAEDVRAHMQEAIEHLEMIYDHLEESVPLLGKSGQRRDAEKAKEHIARALDVAQEALSMPEAKMDAAVQECRDHVETANRQMSRAGMDVVV